VKYDYFVIKIGSGIYAHRASRSLRFLAKEIRKLRSSTRVVIVSSGAILMGEKEIGRKPRTVQDRQILSSVGQPLLLTQFRKFLGRDVKCGQVLLTHEGLRSRETYSHVKNTLLGLADSGIVPVVNENDSASPVEILFGDNDLLASVVAMMIQARHLVFLTPPGGLRGADGKIITQPAEKELGDILRKKETTMGGGKGSGAMKTKVQSAIFAAHAGVSSLITGPCVPFSKLLEGNDKSIPGSFFPSVHGPLSRKKAWLYSYYSPASSLFVDNGARDALLLKGKSLLARGITKITGAPGDKEIVFIKDDRGRALGKGIYRPGKTEVIHRNDAVLYSRRYPPPPW